MSDARRRDARVDQGGLVTSFSQSYYPRHTGTPPVRIECLIMPAVQEPDPSDVTKTIIRTYRFEYAIIVNGKTATTRKGEIKTDDRNAATVDVYGKLIDSLAEYFSTAIALVDAQHGIKIEMMAAP